MEIRPVQAADWPALQALLAAAELDATDLEAHAATLLVATEASDLVGSAALELYGSIALLRSVAVRADYRGTGIGQALVQAMLKLAEAHALERVYLLTTTAADFFARLDFVRAERATAEPALHAAPQWHSLCPASATLMLYRLPVAV